MNIEKLAIALVISPKNSNASGEINSDEENNRHHQEGWFGGNGDLDQFQQVPDSWENSKIMSELP